MTFSLRRQLLVPSLQLLLRCYRLYLAASRKHRPTTAGCSVGSSHLASGHCTPDEELFWKKGNYYSEAGSCGDTLILTHLELLLAHHSKMENACSLNRLTHNRGIFLTLMGFLPWPFSKALSHFFKYTLIDWRSSISAKQFFPPISRPRSIREKYLKIALRERVIILVFVKR